MLGDSGPMGGLIGDGPWESESGWMTEKERAVVVLELEWEVVVLWG